MTYHYHKPRSAPESHASHKIKGMRTCAGTGERHLQGEMLRFVNVRGVPTPDILLGPHRAAGRGVYILPTPEALAAATKRKAFAHRLKTNRPPVEWALIEAHLKAVPSH